MSGFFLSSWDWSLHQLCICTLLPKAHAGRPMAKLNPRTLTSRRSTCRLSLQQSDILTLCPFSGFDIDTLIEQLSKTTPVPIPYSPPPNYGAMITLGSGALSLLLVVRYLRPIITSRWTWAALVIGGSTVFTSGFMFVRIRGTPWVVQRNGQAQWMAGGYQSQYGMEVQVIGAICSLSFLIRSI